MLDFYELSNRLRDQSVDNATDMPFDFYIKIVDENGCPLSEVECSYTILRFNSHWAVGGSSQRGADVQGFAMSNSDGKITIHDVGHAVIVTSLKFPGYSRLYDLHGNVGFPFMSLSERAVLRLSDQGRKGPYQPDPNHPVIFVMVKQGVQIATTLPSAGGSYPPTTLNGPRLSLEPIWPDKPSIPGLKYIPATQPTLDNIPHK